MVSINSFISGEGSALDKMKAKMAYLNKKLKEKDRELTKIRESYDGNLTKV